MAEMRRYVVVGKDDTEGDYEYPGYDDAVTDAQKQGGAVICRIYTYDDTELVWTPDGSDTWPPVLSRISENTELRKEQEGLDNGS